MQLIIWLASLWFFKPQRKNVNQRTETRPLSPRRSTLLWGRKLLRSLPTMTAKDVGSLLPLFPPSPSSVPRCSLHRLRIAWCSPPEPTPHSSHLASRLFFPTGSKSELGPRAWDQDVSVCRRRKLILDLPSILQPADNKENAVGRVSLLNLPINADHQSSHFSHVIRRRQERDASQRRGDA